jgi:hypothetical protein
MYLGFGAVALVLVALVVTMVVVMTDFSSRLDSVSQHVDQSHASLAGVQAEQSTINETLSGLDARVTSGEKSTRVVDVQSGGDASFLDVSRLSELDVPEILQDVHTLNLVTISEGSSRVQVRKSLTYGDVVHRDTAVLTLADLAFNTTTNAYDVPVEVEVPVEEINYALGDLHIEYEIKDEQEPDHETKLVDTEIVLDGSVDGFPRVYMDRRKAAKNSLGGDQISFAYELKVGKLQTFRQHQEDDIEVLENRLTIYHPGLLTPVDPGTEPADKDLGFTLDYAYVDSYKYETFKEDFNPSSGATTDRTVMTPVVKQKSIFVVLRTDQQDYPNERAVQLAFNVQNVRISYQDESDVQHEARVSDANVDNYFEHRGQTFVL